MRPRLAGLLIVWLACSSLPGAVYHVAPAGDDAAAGTAPDVAWKTLERANRQVFKPGDQLLLAAGGTYVGPLELDAKDAGSAKKPVTIASFGEGPRPIIDAGLGHGVLVSDAGGIVVQDLVCVGADRTTNNGCGVAVINTRPKNDRREHIRIRNVEARGFGRTPAAAGAPAGPVGEQRMGGAGILVAGNPADGSKSGFTDVEISGCECHDNAYYGILITGAWDTKATKYANGDVRILDCRVHDNPGDPLYHENHSGSGLLVEDCDGGLVDRCVAWENGAQCDGAPGGPCGIWTAVANNVVIQRCEAYRNRTGTSADGNGFDLDGGCTNCVLQYNYAHDNDGAGILVYTYQDSPHRHHGNVVRWNVCENNAVAKRQYGELYVGDGGDGLTGVEVYHNTFITDQPAEAVVSVVGRKVGVALRNNVIVSTGRVRTVLVEQDAPEIVLQGNAYWNDGFFARLGSRDIADLATWQAAGKELLGTTPLGVWAEPQLDLASARGTAGEVARLPTLVAFTPPATSPAARAGIDLKAKAGIQRGPRDFRDRPLAGVRKPFAGACAVE